MGCHSSGCEFTKVDSNCQCPLHQTATETTFHLMVHCPFAKGVCVGSKLMLRSTQLQANNFKECKINSSTSIGKLMATGVDVREKESVAGIVLNFPVIDDPASSSSSTSKVPRRLRRRLGESKVPYTAEDIEAKLREAQLRRQQYYEILSSKARPKSRSHSRSSVQEEDPGQRLEAKLSAAEQKRLSIVAKVRKRLTKLDELRQAAKYGVEMRREKQRHELGLKIKSRVQQAQENRMLLLKAYKQQRAAKSEQAAMRLMQKKIQERKYKESVCAAIYHKRATAAQKRLGLMEAEKARAHARVLQVWRVAKCVLSQQELERRTMKDHLEDRMLKAGRQREQYLKQRRSWLASVCAYSTMMDEQRAHLSRKIARYWRQFKRLRKTTFTLVKEFEGLGINVGSIKTIPFEQFASQVESPATIQTVKVLLDRLEIRSMISQETSLESINHLLKQVSSSRRGRNSPKERMIQTVGSSEQRNEDQIKLSRYPVRVFLCAYMILGHPNAVFSKNSELEVALVEAAGNFIHNFQLLIKIILEGPIQTAAEKIAFTTPSKLTFRSQLGVFDKAWCSYLRHFVAWKIKDAKLLEDELVRTASQLELSMMQTCKMTAEQDIVGHVNDIRDIQKQVLKDQRLLREKVQHLSGHAGLERMERALSSVRSKYFESKGYGISSSLLIANNSLPCPSNLLDGSSILSGELGTLVEGCQNSSSINLILNEKNGVSWVEANDPSTFKSSTDGHLRSESAAVTENELLVNEILHDHRRGFADSISSGDIDQTGLKGNVKETLEKAFWDCVTESVKQDDPNISWILKLIKEVRDELCEMSPKSWKQDIVETINLDIVSLVLTSRTLDMDYFGKILDFALVTVQKLSAPANDDEVKSNHLKLLKELEEVAYSGDKSNTSSILIKGLRFVLQQIQSLKKEISKARMRMVKPLIKGPTGLEYLTEAFARRHGSPFDAPASLPLTRKWLSSVKAVVEEEWIEYRDFVSILTGSANVSQGLPTNTLRTGGSLMATKASLSISFETGKELPECEGDRIDLLLRLGLLKLVSEVGGLTIETVPETLLLNFSRLRAVQSQLQKIIVISISILILRQIVLSENLDSSFEKMENLVSISSKQLLQLLDSAEHMGKPEIIEAIASLCWCANNILDLEKLESKKQVMANMLQRCLQEGDTVFVQVFRAIYMAARGVVLGGNGVKGRQLVETALRGIGAISLAQNLVEVMEVLVVVAVVSTRVHGAWYEEVLKTL